MSLESLTRFAVSFSAPYAVLAFTAIGSSIVERTGVLNLAIDGLFVYAAAAAYTFNVALSAALGESPWIPILSLAIAAATTALIGILRTFLSTALPVHQGALGLSLMFACYGVAAIVGNSGVNMFSQLPLDVKRGVSFVVPGTMSALTVYTSSLLVAAALWAVISRTRLGALIRGAGEDPRTLAVLGVSVVKIRVLASVIGDLLVGVGGALLTLYWYGSWKQGYGTNTGWIAYAIAIAAGRNPLLVLAITAPFAVLYNLFPLLQAAGLPVDLAKAAPFIAALATMVVYAVTPAGRRFRDPKYLGREFHLEERA